METATKNIVLPAKATKVEKPNGAAKIEYLAGKIETSRDDDSLALEHSLLRSDQADVMENVTWPYWITLLPMLVVSAWVALKVWTYRLVVRPKDKERWLLGPKHGTWLFDSHWLGYIVRNGVTTSAALDAIYSYPAIQFGTSLLDRLVHFWFKMPEGAAVRNRVRNTYKALRDEVFFLYSLGRGRMKGSVADTIKMLSLACGSAQAAVEALAALLKQYPNAQIELTLVDLSKSSLKRAYRLAQHLGVADHVQVLDANLKEYLKALVVARKEFDVIEMVGFLDYRSWNSAISICGQIRKILSPHGMFVSAHIAPSPWAFVVRWVVNWPLLRRRPSSKFRRILVEAGYDDLNEITIIEEPFKIHPIALCRREADHDA